jgi:type II secretory pathway component GspD/PulD (secretin)
LLKDDGKVRYGDVIVTNFSTSVSSTDNAKNLLDGMKLSVNITPIPETGTLIVTGYTYRMTASMRFCLSSTDPAPKAVRFRPLKYTMAATLAEGKIPVNNCEISITVGAPAAATAPTPAPARRRPQTQPQPGAAEGGRPSVYLDADERTNRILMIGFETQLNTVDQLIDALDVEKQDLRMIRLYDIQYVGAEEVKNKLVELGIIGGELRQHHTECAIGKNNQTKRRSPSLRPLHQCNITSVTEQPLSLSTQQIRCW